MATWITENKELVLSLIALATVLGNIVITWLEKRSPEYITDKHWDYIRDAYDIAINETTAAVKEGTIIDGGFKSALLSRLLTGIAAKWLKYNEGGDLPYSVQSVAAEQILEAIERTANGEV